MYVPQNHHIYRKSLKFGPACHRKNDPGDWRREFIGLYWKGLKKMMPSQELLQRSINSIKRELGNLDSANTHQLDLEEMLHLTRQAYLGIAIPVLTYFQAPGPKEDPHYGIFRARFFNDLPTHTKFIMEPPPEAVLNIGRCNNIKESIFYCSNHFATALIECRAKAGERWVVGDFEFNDDESLTAVALGVKRQAILKQSISSETPESFLADFDDSNKKKHYLVDNHLHKSFNTYIEPASHKYKRTLAATYFFTDRWRLVDSILYPSVAAGLNGVNVAIKANARKRVLKIKKAYSVTIDRLDIKKFALSYSPNAVGFIDGEEIKWELVDAKTNIFLP